MKRLERLEHQLNIPNPSPYLFLRLDRLESQFGIVGNIRQSLDSRISIIENAVGGDN